MVREEWALATIAVVVFASIATAFFVAPLPGVSSTTSTTTTSTTTTTSSTASTTISTTTASSFTFSPQEPLQVISVGAQTLRDSTSGKVYLTLSVLFKNAGSSAVYVTKGCGSSLSANVTSSSVISEISGPRCLCAEYISPLNPGDSLSALTPGCWSGVTYEVVHPGTILVEMTLTYYGGQNFQNQGKTTIEATFTLE